MLTPYTLYVVPSFVIVIIGIALAAYTWKQHGRPVGHLVVLRT